MSTKITLTDDQVNEVLDHNKDLKYNLFKDTLGAVTIDEKASFPIRLKFYMNKMDLDSQGLIDKITANYSYMVKSKTSIHHYLRGIRIPKLSMVFAIAEALEISPAQLLPAVKGQYIQYTTDHVEMLNNPIYQNDEVKSETEEKVEIEQSFEDEEFVSEFTEETESKEVDEVELVFIDSVDDDEKDLEPLENLGTNQGEENSEIKKIDTEDEEDTSESEVISLIEDQEEDQDEEIIIDSIESQMLEEDDDFDNISLTDDEIEETDNFLKNLFHTVKEIPFDQEND